MGSLFLIPTVLAPGTAGQVLARRYGRRSAGWTTFSPKNLRTSRRFISELKTGRSIESLTFYELNKDTPEAETAGQMQILLDGNDAGVLSEAGCPGVADPGAVAVRLAHRMGIRVVPLVGPSSILLALMGSGFSGQSFAFHGYLPIDRDERSKALRQLEKEALQKNQTQIFMETPFRNNQLLDELLRTCHPNTPRCIACQITAPDELILTLPVKEWKKQRPDLHKKPTVFLLYRG